MARSMGATAEDQGRVAAIAGTVQALLDVALGCSDPVRAREVLPAAGHALAVASVQLVGPGLVPGAEWFYQQHRLLYQRAVGLFGPEQQVVEPCAIEPLTPPAPIPGQHFPR